MTSPQAAGGVHDPLASQAPRADSAVRSAHCPRGPRFAPAPAAPKLLVWFPRTLVELRADAARVAVSVEPGVSIWIAWSKEPSGVAADLSEAEVRRAGFQNGLVDYKVCAIYATWSGLQFTRRRSPGG